MKRIATIAIVLASSILSGYVAWRIFGPKPKVLDTYGDMGADMGFDRVWFRKVGDIIHRASTDQCREISSSDYDDVYKLLKSDHELAQLQALLILGSCPPSDKATWYPRIHTLNRKTLDPGLKLSTFGTLWNLDLSKHGEIREEARASNLPGVADAVTRWPDRRLTNNDH